MTTVVILMYHIVVVPSPGVRISEIIGSFQVDMCTCHLNTVVIAQDLLHVGNVAIILPG